VSLERGEPCAECGSALAADQHYCLVCGARVGAPDAQLSTLLARVREQGAQPAPTLPDAAARTPPGSSLRLPSARVSALLVAMFLVFGVAIGNAATPRLDTTLAAARQLRVVLPAAGATASASPVSPPSSTAAGGEQPPPESAPTPSPASETASTTTKPAPAAGKQTASASEPSREESVPTSSSALAAIKHVFVVMLSDQPYASVFGPASQAHYLSHTLEHKGTLLVQYDAVAHEELANEIALLSGQGPTGETAANCPTYGDVAATGTGSEEQLLGNGCVYPATTQTLPAQLLAKHLSSRAYVEGIGEPGDPQAACAHPPLGAADPTAEQAASSGAYATFRNPFVYFHSIIDSPSCAADDVGLDKLEPDLASAKGAPSFAYIVPDRCHDGNPTPCMVGAPAGLAPADAFIAKVVPQITASKAYKDGGLLVITVDQAPSSGELADSSSCCGQPAFPDVPPSSTARTPRGGGTVGALLLSPLIKGASTDQEPYNHFSLLRTIEDIFGLKHLGYAGLPSVKPFAAAVFTPPPAG
jgi:phosphatidylinositol-3-phosphatase